MKNIFLLEDDSDELNRIKDTLELRLPVQIFPIPDSEASIQIIQKHYDIFSAYILDIEMSGQKYSGIQVAEAIRNQPQCALVPIIFLTSHAHFGAGGLHYIHYYEFFQKPCDVDRLVATLQEALSINSINEHSEHTTINIESNHLSVELDLEDISCIEIFGTQLYVTDLLGKVATYKVKPNVFSSICQRLKTMGNCSLRQIHRTVIINVNRIKRIEWRKNTATVWLFNVKDWKPAGKTYLNVLSPYSE